MKYKVTYVFGYKFKDYDALINDLVTLAKEGCIYAHFYDEISKGFKYYKIKFTPVEIFKYVEAHIARNEFNEALDKGATFKRL